jgi:hypothetical protein
VTRPWTRVVGLMFASCSHAHGVLLNRKEGRRSESARGLAKSLHIRLSTFAPEFRPPALALRCSHDIEDLLDDEVRVFLLDRVARTRDDLLCARTEYEPPLLTLDVPPHR